MRKKLKDLTGQRFGRLKVLYLIGTNTNIGEPTSGERIWACECRCGNWTIATTWQLTSGRKCSCGCLHEEITRTWGYRNKNTALYRTLFNLRRACYDPESDSYADFGAKGIKFCDEWNTLNTDKFREWSYENGYEPGKSLLRYDRDGDYSPDNCYWE